MRYRIGVAVDVDHASTVSVYIEGKDMGTMLTAKNNSQTLFEFFELEASATRVLREVVEFESGFLGLDDDWNRDIGVRAMARKRFDVLPVSF